MFSLYVFVYLKLYWAIILQVVEMSEVLIYDYGQ